MKRENRPSPPSGTTKVIVPEHPQDSKDSEILEVTAHDAFTQTGKRREENRLSVETKFSQATRWGIVALGGAICVLIICLAAMYCIFIARLTFHFFNDVPMLINFLTETWRTITSASAGAVPFLIYLLRKETKDR